MKRRGHFMETAAAESIIPPPGCEGRAAGG